MPLRFKIALCALMGLGVLVGACCIVRMVLNFQSIPLDTTYGGLDNWFWRLFEVQLGIIAACAPALRPGYKLLTGKVSSIIDSYSNSSAGGDTGRKAFLSSSHSRNIRGKHVELTDQEQERKCRGNKTSVSKVSYGGSTELGSEDAAVLALPQNAILKKTTVDVDPDSLQAEKGTFYEDRSGTAGRPSLEVDVSPDFKRSMEVDRNERLGLRFDMV